MFFFFNLKIEYIFFKTTYQNYSALVLSVCKLTLFNRFLKYIIKTMTLFFLMAGALRRGGVKGNAIKKKITLFSCGEVLF